jgi:hypothetical protein
MIDKDNLPAHLAAVIAEETKGQTLIWAGQSNPRHEFVKGMGFWLFAIPWTAGVVVWESLAVGMWLGWGNWDPKPDLLMPDRWGLFSQDLYIDVSTGSATTRRPHQVDLSQGPREVLIVSRRQQGRWRARSNRLHDPPPAWKYECVAVGRAASPERARDQIAFGNVALLQCPDDRTGR